MSWQTKGVVVGVMLGVGGLLALAGQIIQIAPTQKLAEVIKRVEPLEAVCLAKMEVVRRQIIQQRIIESYDARKILPRPNFASRSTAKRRLMELESLEVRFLQGYERLWQETCSCLNDGSFDLAKGLARIKDLHKSIERLEVDFNAELAMISDRALVK
jgi:hypothetical protein